MCVFIHECQTSGVAALAQAHAHWQKESHAHFKEIILFTYLKQCTFFDLLPRGVGRWFFCRVFYVPGYIFCFEHCGTIKRSCFFGVGHLVVDLQTFREIPFSSRTSLKCPSGSSACVTVELWVFVTAWGLRSSDPGCRVTFHARNVHEAQDGEVWVVHTVLNLKTRRTAVSTWS